LCLENRECFDYVTNITCAFEKPYGGKLGLIQPPTMFDFFRENEKSPLNIHIHVKKHKISEVPKKSEDLKKFLLDMFIEKEELLSCFDKNGKFPGEQYCQPIVRYFLIQEFGGFAYS
jgi:hypothetical protein